MARSRKGNVEAIIAALAVLLTAASVDAVMVSLVPSNATIPSVGSSTVVNVNIANVTGLESIGVNITYSGAIASVPVGGVQLGQLAQGCSNVQVNIDVPGRLIILAPCPNQPIAGSGTLFSITFNGSALGTTPLAFTTLIVDGNVRIPNGCLLNEGIPSCEPVNGTLSVGAPPTNTATATATRTNTVGATGTFTATRTSTLTPTRTATASNTPTGVINTATVTRTFALATATASSTSTAAVTNTATRTVTNTPTGPAGTPTNTLPPPSTATATLTPLVTSTATATGPPPLTATITSTFTAAATGTVTATRTITNTAPPTSTRPGIPVVPSPISPAGIVLISSLAVALLWALQRLQRPQ